MSTDLLTPIDRYLAEQRGTSAAERFAAQHDAVLTAPEGRWYADRMPATPPAPGQQYAFQVDLDRCTGCTSCVAACHSLNGLDHGESWRSVGLLVGDNAGAPRQQTVPSGCHHCLDPACLAGCPTNAYEKDPATGIVRHLDDQCFGCGYCELTCPYEVPKLNHRLGIVRKCDMCSDRLAEGEAPACVQACPTSAITIAVVDVDGVDASTATGALVPGAPASSITRPTTQYVGVRSRSADLHAADDHALRLSHSHLPLVFMLVVTQVSVGAFLATLAVGLFGDGLPAGGAIGAAVAGVVALAASFLHVGRPLVAYRAVLGIGHSWMSREAAAFAVYAPLTVLYALGVATDVAPSGTVDAVGIAAALTGIAGVVCSALLYVVTARTWWSARYTFTKFILTAAGAGPLLVATIMLAAAVAAGAEPDSVSVVVPLLGVAATATLCALVAEALFLLPGRWSDASDLGRTARLLRERLSSVTGWRFVAGSVGGVVLPAGMALAVASGTSPDPLLLAVATGSLVVMLCGALLERYEFFVASTTPRMPGGFRR